MSEKERLILYTADVSPLMERERFEAAYRSVSPARREKTDRYRFEADKRLSLGAELLLQHACRFFGIAFEQEKIIAGEWEKPRFESGRAAFNLSHSGNTVLCAISELPVGCDVQKKDPGQSQIARRFFHPEEYAALCACATEEERDRLFYRLWTLKESFIKCTGRGLSMPLDSFRICFTPEGVRTEQCFDTNAYRFFENDPGDGNAYACCVLLPEGSGEKAPVPVWRNVTLEELL